MTTPRRDAGILYGAAALAVIGFFALVSASLGLLDRGGSPLGILAKQALGGLGLGIVALVAADRIPLGWLRKSAFWIFCAAFLLTLAVFIPGIGFESGGAVRWIAVGPVFFQPSEFLKIAFILYLAAWLASRGSAVRSFEFGILPLSGIMLAIGAVFVRQPDIGTLGVVIISGVLLFYAAGGRLRHIGVLGIVVAILFAAVVLWKPYVLDRVTVFLNPSFDTQGAGYQARQAAIALGSGGLFGRGFGASLQKFHYLPEPLGDAIFAVFGEEFGFFGTAALTLLFGFLLWRCVFVSRSVSDPFARLLGFGIGILITVQAFVHMGAVSGVLPLTGITLPFISHGGSSLVTTLAAVGLLLNISKHRT